MSILHYVDQLSTSLHRYAPHDAISMSLHSSHTTSVFSLDVFTVMFIHPWLNMTINLAMVLIITPRTVNYHSVSYIFVPNPPPLNIYHTPRQCFTQLQREKSECRSLWFVFLSSPAICPHISAVNFCSKVGQNVPKWDKSGTFSDQIFNFLAIFWHSNGNFAEGQVLCSICRQEEGS